VITEIRRRHRAVEYKSLPVGRGHRGGDRVDPVRGDGDREGPSDLRLIA
jgi:hypothetical protein